MNRFVEFSKVAGFLCGFAALVSAQGLVVPSVHPGFNLQDIRPSTLKAQVGGLDFLPDGRMVICTWYGFGSTKGDVYLVDKAQSGDKNQVTTKTFASGLNEPLGLTVVDGVIYILTKDALVRLPDANKDDKADAVETVVKGWQYHSEEAKNLEFAMGLIYRKGLFYAGLATRWPLDAAQSTERGCVLSLDPAKPTTFSAVACGLRTPNGFVIGPEGEIFITENQGNWVPDSKLIHVQQDHFYGVHKTANQHPLESKPESQPAIWLPHGDISISPTQPVYLTTGVFKGQMLAGDNNMGTLQRYYLEKVQGEYQGMVIGFAAGIEAAANRIVVGPDGAIYVGCEGVGADVWSGWGWNSKNYGLARLTEKSDATYFDILAIRNKGADSFEIEFTEPAADAAGQAANYTVRTRGYTPKVDYGCCKDNWAAVTVASATLSTDKKKVTLKVNGLKAKTAVNFQFKNFDSQAGHTLWAKQAWYTLNAFGPGTDAPVTIQAPVRSSQMGALRYAHGQFQLPEFTGQAQFEVWDLQGHCIQKTTTSATVVQVPGGQTSGLYLARCTLPDGKVESLPFYLE